MDGVADIIAAVRARKTSAREVTDGYLARIAAHDPALGCFYHVDVDGARARADAVDARLARGEDAGPLAGVPIAVKDLFVTRGLPTTAGSKILRGWIPPYDGTAILRLHAAGAVLVGKLSMDEFAMGSSNESSAFGPVKNPWDARCVPGGSSGGSAAAVAAELCAASLGTDTGGSIRQPAALCGVSGIKPTYGRVSRYGVVAFASSLDQPGTLGRSAEDCALVLEAIAGHDARDATSLPHPVPGYAAACAQSPTEALAGLRVGVPEEYLSQTPPPMVATVSAALDELVRAGARLVSIKLPHTEYGIAAYYLIATAEASSNLARYDGVRYGLRVDGPGGVNELYARTRAAGFGDEVKRRILLGTYALRSGYYDAYYLKAQKVRTLIQRDFTAAFASCDVIATPTSPTVAFQLGERVADPLSMYLADVFTIPCNLAGLPGMSIPCGFLRPEANAPELPVGLQLLGPVLGEEILFRVAGAYQRLTDWHRRRPPLVAS